MVAGGAAVLEAAGSGFVGIADGEAAAALEQDGDAAAFRHEAFDMDEVDIGERCVAADARRAPAERHEHEVRRQRQWQLLARTAEELPLAIAHERHAVGEDARAAFERRAHGARLDFAAPVVIEHDDTFPCAIHVLRQQSHDVTVFFKILASSLHLQISFPSVKLLFVILLVLLCSILAHFF